jgi:hypothetical protein
MEKSRKQHQLIGVIENSFLSHSKNRKYKNQPFYYLEIIRKDLLLDNKKETIYAFLNLVSKSI